MAALSAALTLGAGGFGCASTQQPAAPPPQRATGAVSDLHATIRVVSDAPEANLGQQYAAALRWAGVEVVPSIADADVVTELRLTTRKGKDAQDVADVVLEVRGGTMRLSTASVSYPLHSRVSNHDLSVLTSALTDSHTVRTYAHRVAQERTRRSHAADQTAWQKANAETCAQSPRFEDCTEVIRYLNGFPKGEHRAAAEAALAQAETVRQRASRDAAIQRVKAELTAWQIAAVEECRAPSTPDACDGVRAYLTAFPNGRFAPEAHEVLTQSQPRLNELREQVELKGAIALRRSKVTAQR